VDVNYAMLTLFFGTVVSLSFEVLKIVISRANKSRKVYQLLLISYINFNIFLPMAAFHAGEKELI